MPTISGNVGAVFNGGTITLPLVVDLSAAAGDTVPLTVKASFDAQNADFFAVVNSDAGGAEMLSVDPSGAVLVRGATNTRHGGLNVYSSTGTAPVQLSGNPAAVGISVSSASSLFSHLIEADGGVGTAAISSGSLPTVTFVSGTGTQITTRDVTLVVPCTFTPTAGAAATVVVALSPDDLTYSTVGTATEPAGVALDGTVQVLTLGVPIDWFVKLTATNATIGTGTYY